MFVATVTTFLVLASQALPFPQADVPNVEPEFLDMLLKTEQYELFSKLMKIDDVDRVRPKNRERTEKSKAAKGRRIGDILPSKRSTEESRQGMRFDRNPNAKWKGGKVPYVISTEYEPYEIKIIKDAIQSWNKQIKCVKLVPRTIEQDYVMIFSGDGCYSTMGRTGGQQPLSIEDDGCLEKGTILHEMEHAIGIAHEHNRPDRDEYIEMLWDNILDEWTDQFEKEDLEEYEINGKYDYYSLMHYEVIAPDTSDPAFKVKQPNINESIIGKANDFTKEDIAKINNLYCGKKGK